MEKYSTSDLSEELSGREGVTYLEAAPYEKIKITVGTKEIEMLGPAVIIVNQD
jgi:hypothetical protein